MTLVAKATFRFVHDGVAQLVDPLDVVVAERIRPTGSAECASEAAPYQPNAGVVVTGHAYAPAARPVPSTSVRLGLVAATGKRLIDKTLHVFGDRAPGVENGLQPFERMPLVYERACRGSDNPVGVPPGGSMLPNVVDPADPRRPAGFGPIASQWPARRGLLGTVDPAALMAPIPELPVPFDWRYFQAAPADQQLDVLCGGEWIVLDGMNPSLARIQTRLPDLATRAEWQPATLTGPGAARPVALYADMLVINADRLLCSVIWRGRFTLERPAMLADIRVSVGVEVRGDQRTPAEDRRLEHASPTSGAEELRGASLAETGALDLAAVLRRLLPFQPTGHDLAGTLPLREGGVGVGEAPARPMVQSGPAASSLDPPGTGATDAGAPLATPARAPGAGLAATLDPGEPNPFLAVLPFAPAPLATPARAPGAGLAATLDPGEPNPFLAVLPFAPADPAHPPIESVASAPPVRAAASLKGTAAFDPRTVLKPSLPFAAAPSDRIVGATTIMDDRTAQPSVMAQSASAHPPAPAPFVAPPPPVVPPPAVAPSEPLANGLVPPSPSDSPRPVYPAAPVPTAEPKAPAFAPEPAHFPISRAEPDAGSSLRATVIARLAARKPILDLVLAGADLADLDLAGASLGRANLTGARLSHCKLTGARLAGAQLVGADLTGADLEGADLGHADLSRATLAQARLSGAVLEEANLSGAQGQGAILEGAKGARASFARGQWDDASFTRAEVSQADFTAASLARARFEGASLVEARFDGARGPGAVFDDARLSQARVAGAGFPGASFRRADGRGSVWEKATLDDASFAGGDFANANLARASCARASFAGANLAGANLQRLVGDGADLAGAKLPRADVRQARLVEAKLDGAVLADLVAGKADFSRARFVRADLAGATLRSARLAGANFAHATLERADLMDAELEGANLFGASRRTAMLGTGARGFVEVDPSEEP